MSTSLFDFILLEEIFALGRSFYNSIATAPNPPSTETFFAPPIPILEIILLPGLMGNAGGNLATSSEKRMDGQLRNLATSPNLSHSSTLVSHLASKADLKGESHVDDKVYESLK